MAYANIILENSTTAERMVKPLGFSWPTLLLPFLAAALNYIIYSAVIALHLAFNVPSILSEAIIVVMWVVISLSGLLSVAIVPLSRKDVRWVIIMVIGGIFSFGISAVIFSFIYNYIYLTDKLKDGFLIKNIVDGIEDQEPIISSNPLKFNEQSGEFYIWIDLFRVKYMKYFDTVSDAIQFVTNYPQRCMEVRHIAKAVNRLAKKDDTLRDRFRFPISEWEDNLELKNAGISTAV